jgi:hypothetical protein
MSGSEDKLVKGLVKSHAAIEESNDQQLALLTKWSNEKDPKKKKGLAALYFKEMRKGFKLQEQHNKDAEELSDSE